jgi:chromosome segregation ATPase
MTDDFMNLPLDEEFDTMMDVQQNPHGAWQAIQTLTDQIEGLKKELNICRMAQVVMENGIAEAEKERDDYAFKLADANNTYNEMHIALEEANDKLAKAVEGLRNIRELNMTAEDENGHQWANSDLIEQEIVAKLAEIEGDRQ